MHNPYIEFLRRYGPVPASDNLYDETIQSSARRLGIRPIEVPLEELDTLVDNFQGSAPHSVILTGTAGDGKTFLCRQIWSRLGGEPKAWERCDKIHTLPLSAAGKELLIIKDLSELTPQQKDQYLPQMAAAISGADSQTVYLLAANDGQLVASLQRAAEVDGANAEQLKKLVEELLVTDRQQAEGYALKLFNLSRNHAPSLLDKILDEIVQHNDWEHCTECPHHRDGPARCPIYENRMRLMPSEDNRFRLRLRALLELAEANRLHLPIRHLLMLSVNILLGNEDAGGGLMTCKQAIECIADATTAKASPYSNVFGSNLAAKKRQQHLCFSVLDSFGIGRETSNTVDDLLVYGRDSNILLTAYQQLVGDDTYYGASKYYETQRGRYVEGFRENGDGAKLLDLLPAQRQRLFFTAAQESNGKFSPWMLTVYHFAGDFLAMRTALEQTQSVAVHLAALITGLNRVFTGMMVRNPIPFWSLHQGGMAAAVSVLYWKRKSRSKTMRVSAAKSA